jgi:hypothetical protein
VCLTTNLSVGSWDRVFADDTHVAAAMLDRLLHRSVVFNIDGDSYRMRAHRARTERLSRRPGRPPGRKECDDVASRPHQPPGAQVGNFDERLWGISVSVNTEAAMSVQFSAKRTQRRVTWPHGTSTSKGPGTNRDGTRGTGTTSGAVATQRSPSSRRPHSAATLA